MAKVSVIIPNYNGIKYIEDCLNSLKEQTFSDFDIWVIDNASTDGSGIFAKDAPIKSIATGLVILPIQSIAPVTVSGSLIPEK